VVVEAYTNKPAFHLFVSFRSLFTCFRLLIVMVGLSQKEEGREESKKEGGAACLLT
jgi:hypothetical protein